MSNYSFSIDHALFGCRKNFNCGFFLLAGFFRPSLIYLFTARMGKMVHCICVCMCIFLISLSSFRSINLEVRLHSLCVVHMRVWIHCIYVCLWSNYSLNTENDNENLKSWQIIVTWIAKIEKERARRKKWVCERDGEWERDIYSQRQ